MNEDQARAWVRERFGVSRENKLAQFAKLLTDEAANQNLIAASTIESMWTRHLVDSAQLVPLAAEAEEGAWVDIGSGAGLPGIVVAVLLDRPVILVEPRIRRVEFLRAVAEAMSLDNVTIEHGKIEGFEPASSAAIVSARAVAELSKLFRAAHHCTGPSTMWLLPKGVNAQSEVAAARQKWHGLFHVEPSMTQPDSGIVVAKGVRPR